MLIHAPLTTHEVQTAETQHDGLLETRHEHTHETDAGEVVDAAFLVLVLDEGDAELIPVHARRVAIAQFHAAGTHIGDEAVVGGRAVTEGFEDLRTDAHLVLIITLKLVEGIVAIDVFHIGAALVTGVVGFPLVVRIRRVALGVVDQFVTVENALLLVIVIRASEVVIVVACRVVAPRLDHAVVGHDACTDHSIHPLLIGAVIAFLGIRQTVQTHILQLARAARSGKGVSLRGLYGNLTPLGGHKRASAVDGHAALVEFLAIAEDILAHLSQIDVEVAAIVGGCAFLTGIDEGVEHPELDILDVGLLEVGGLQFAHHAAPLRLGLSQGAVAVEVARQIVRATFLRIVSQIEHGERRGGTVVGTLVAVGVKFLHIDLSHVVVRQLIQVALDVARGQCRGSAGEDGVNGVPCQSCSVITTRHTSLIGSLIQCGRHTRERPRLRIAHVDIVLRVLKVVDIRGVVLCAAGGACDQLGKLSCEGDVRRLLHMQERYLVEHVGEPLRLLFPVHVQSPEGIAQRLGTHGDLRGQCLLGEVHQRSAELEVLREVVFPVHAHHRLPLHAVVGVRLQRHVDVRACIDDALVQDGHLACGIVHRVVGAFRKRHAASRHDD